MPPLVERERLASSGVGGDATDGSADGVSGTPLLASLAGATRSAEGRADGVFSGALVVRASLAGAAQSAGARFLRRRVVEDTLHFVLVVVQALLLAAWGFQRLRRQTRNKQRNFVRTSDDSSLSSLQFVSLSAAHIRR